MFFDKSCPVHIVSKPRGEPDKYSDGQTQDNKIVANANFSLNN